jgi:transcriptional regulator with XRE-family HTH domain
VEVDVAEDGGSAVSRWQLAETLRGLREEIGFTHDQVIAELKKGQGTWSRPKLSRIENKEQRVKPPELKQLLDVYDLRDGTIRQWLFELADTPRARGWVSDIRKHLPQEFHRFLDWEVELVALRKFETLLVPGLLQTPEYARAIISGINPGLTEYEVEQRVMARIARQQILGRAKPPRLHVILDVGVLERPVGGPSVMRNQLRHLIEAAETTNVTIQILPKAVGASPALEGPFSILSLPEPVPDFGYAEGPEHDAYIEDREKVRAFTLRFGMLTEQSLSQADSVSCLAEVSQSYD